MSAPPGRRRATGPDRPDPVPVARTAKLYLGGGFPRSESGRSYPVHDARGRLLAHAARASRKDVRDAVAAARGALPGWSGASAYNRGQVLYRVAEMLQGRREQFVAEVLAAEGGQRRRAQARVDAAIERWVWYAGWTDKLAGLLGSVNPVAGPYDCTSAPVPVGVVGVLAPARSSLLGLVSVLAPVLASGATAVLVASEHRPLPAVSLGEVLATSDVPGGVANLLTGVTSELAPVLAGHAEVDALDLVGAVPGDEPDPVAAAAELERAAAGSLTRVLARPATEPDFTAAPDLARLRLYSEIRTVWHPIGY